MSEARRIADELRRSISGEAWHGPSVLEILDDVTAAEAYRKPIAGVHSIAELVAHVHAWIASAHEGLRRGQVIELTGEGDWPIPGQSADDWQQLVARLRDSITALAAEVEQIADADFSQKVRSFGREYPRWFLLHGVAQHNSYHGGQMAVVKKALRSSQGPADSAGVPPAL